MRVWPGYSYFFRVPTKSLDLGPSTESRLPNCHLTNEVRLLTYLYNNFSNFNDFKNNLPPTPRLGLFLKGLLCISTRECIIAHAFAWSKTMKNILKS